MSWVKKGKNAYHSMRLCYLNTMKPRARLNPILGGRGGGLLKTPLRFSKHSSLNIYVRITKVSDFFLNFHRVSDGVIFSKKIIAGTASGPFLGGKGFLDPPLFFRIHAK